MLVIKMNKILAFVLLLIISAILIQPINIKANSNNDIIYEVVKRNPDLFSEFYYQRNFASCIFP
jgi:hypothetical protein